MLLRCSGSEKVEIRYKVTAKICCHVEPNQVHSPFALLACFFFLFFFFFFFSYRMLPSSLDANAMQISRPHEQKILSIQLTIPRCTRPTVPAFFEPASSP